MARPRIFISSTYFDLRVVRADLERFVKEVGYEPVLFERGQVPYTKDEALEDSCYREISGCDVLVAIIGGRFGTTSNDQRNSISQKELQTAIELGKQIYVFVEKAVHAEYNTYLANKDVVGFKPSAVNDVRVFQFIEQIYGLPAGNPVQSFEISQDIVQYLREQWAGLFQRLLQESSRQREIKIIEDLKATASTLDNLVTFLSKDRSKGNEAIKDILLSSHPAFGAVKKAVSIPYRVVFHTLDELTTLLNQRSFVRDKKIFKEGFIDFDNQKDRKGVRVKASIFEPNGKLRIMTPEEWDHKNIETYNINPPQPPASQELTTATPGPAAAAPQEEDDVPF